MFCFSHYLTSLLWGKKGVDLFIKMDTTVHAVRTVMLTFRVLVVVIPDKHVYWDRTFVLV